MKKPKGPTIVLPPSTTAADPTKPVAPTDEEIAKQLAAENARIGRSSFLVASSAPAFDTGLSIAKPSY